MKAHNKEATLTPKQIRTLLHKNGCTQRHLAETLGVTESHVSQVLHGKRWSPRVMREFSDRTGVSYDSLVSSYRRVLQREAIRPLDQAA